MEKIISFSDKTKVCPQLKTIMLWLLVTSRETISSSIPMIKLYRLTHGDSQPVNTEVIHLYCIIIVSTCSS